MATVDLLYSSTAQITITLNSLSNGLTRESTAVDNSSNKYLDASIDIIVSLSNGTVAGDKAVNVFFYGSVDGVNYTDNATGVDAALTMRSPTNLRGPFVISAPANGPVSYRAVIGSVASFFGGVLPIEWGIVVQNTSGVIFLTSSNAVAYLGFE